MNLTVEKLLTPYNFSDRATGARAIKYIVIHYFGSLGTAKSVANYFASAYRGASAHYALDEGSIVYQCVEDEDVAWHCGTTGTYYHSECRNSNSIGIEVRPYILDKSKYTDASYRGWYFTETIENNLVEFTKYLMKKYNIDVNHVVRHYDVTHKLCPRPWVGDDTNLYYNATGNALWAKFKARLSGEEELDMDEATLRKIIKEEIASAKTSSLYKTVNDVPATYRPAIKWLNELGLLTGYSGGADSSTATFDDNEIRVDETFCRLAFIAYNAHNKNLL